MFRGLRSLDGCDVVGLIQHGGRQLRAGASREQLALPVASRIYRSSRAILSLREVPRVTGSERPSAGGGVNLSPAAVAEAIWGFFYINLAMIAAWFGANVKPGSIEDGLFDDFIWRTFFSKTLQPADKALVTAARFRILRQSRKRFHQIGLAGRRYSSVPHYLGVDTQEFNVFLAQTPFPARVSPGTQLVVRYHDAVPLFMPHTISDSAFHQASHFYALQENVRAGAWFSCVSAATRDDLLKVFPAVEPRTAVIHNIVSDDYFEEQSPPEVVRQIVRNRVAKVHAFTTDIRFLDAALSGAGSSGLDYLLMVSTIEPRKNHLLLTAAWERLKYGAMPRLQLVVVGHLGWAYQPVLEAFRPWAERGDLLYLNNVPSAELRVLYRHAAATLCPSLAEGFDYSGIEAMRCGGIVIASAIAVHREVFGGGAVYFDPYSAEDAATVITQVLSDDGKALRERLRGEGARISNRYTPAAILPQWEAFLDKVQRARLGSGWCGEGGSQ
ncbi:glycosyltransferase family 1 protein [uncultured Thiodictyon sp.]|uniref:glycosyltransferase family 4 protein n=1 Tax=uncultured Thiodictyon sp. TaxID=1846217 RepID=UPI0025D42D3C|nr:glycosyltransferase family 1 protein [uncultured Thiodictyon sp.]